MTRILNRLYSWYPPHRGRIAIAFLLFLCFSGIEPALIRAQAQAADVEVLTPLPGATVVARNPETHLVLRQFWNGEPLQVRVEKSGVKLKPVVVDRHKENNYLHFRLPLEPGKNSFTVVPGGQRVELTYRQLQADLNPNSFGKDVYLFHQDDKLPQRCEGCHDLQNTTPIENMGLKKQTSCIVCHPNVIKKDAWQHSPTVSQQCLTCHQKSVRPWRIGFPAAKIEDTCFTCHTGKKAWKSRAFIHGPMIFGGCTLCHNPHGDKYRYQLWAEGSVALCITCHGDKENLVQKENPLPFVHGIIKGQGCVACHDPHATDQQFMLRKPINELCVGCHTGLAGISRGHPVGGHPVAGPKERRRPGRELTCASCHDPHGSRFRYLLIGDSRGGNVCIPCHR